MAQYVSNKCLSITPTMENTNHRFSKHIFLVLILTSLACLVTSAPLTSDSDGSQKQSLFSGIVSASSLASSALSPESLSFSSPSHESLSHLEKRSVSAPYSGHSIMRFGRAAHSIMHFGKRSNEQLNDMNVANEPLLSNENTETDDFDDTNIVSSYKQIPLLTDGINRLVLVPVNGLSNKLVHYFSNNKRAVSKFQDETLPAVGRDNVFMHFG